MLAFVLSTALALADEGFGGEAPLDEDVCTVKGDDGVWRSCAEVLDAKERGGQEPERDESPEAQALRERMKAADAVVVEEKPVKTRYEIELEKAHLDPSMPLLALRVDVARAQELLDRLENAGTGGRAKEEAEARLAAAERTLDAVERIALHRMDVCSQRRGNKPVFKNFRMTAGGPVLLSTRDIMAQLPLVDPYGCERITLIDKETVERVKRVEELKRVLATTSFGYHDVSKRRALEDELKVLEQGLAKEALPALAAPGVKDPYGGR